MEGGGNDRGHILEGVGITGGIFWRGEELLGAYFGGGRNDRGHILEGSGGGGLGQGAYSRGEFTA